MCWRPLVLGAAESMKKTEENLMNVRRTLGFWPLRGSAGWLLAASLLLCGWLSPNLAFAQADLTVDITSVTDTTPQQGQSVTVRYRIRNGSRTTTANNFTVRFYLSSDATITTADRYLHDD